MPPWLTPDRLTAVGLGAVILALAGYVLVTRHPAWLWLVNTVLVLNWLGDSLDGHVAHLRGIERPRYGFFLDQSIDVLSQLLFALGLAMSGYIWPEIVMLSVAAYLMMTVQGLLRVQTTRVFHLATGGMGLTKVRCPGNILFYFALAVRRCRADVEVFRPSPVTLDRQQCRPVYMDDDGRAPANCSTRTTIHFAASHRTDD
jgi:archaetidylinositol phosphate synthase